MNSILQAIVYFTDDDVTDRCAFCGRPYPSVCDGKCRR